MIHMHVYMHGEVDVIKANETPQCGDVWTCGQYESESNSTMCRYVEMWRLLKRMKLHNVEICGDVQVIKANECSTCGDMWRCVGY